MCPSEAKGSLKRFCKHAFESRLSFLSREPLVWRHSRMCFMIGPSLRFVVAVRASQPSQPDIQRFLPSTVMPSASSKTASMSNQVPSIEGQDPLRVVVSMMEKKVRNLEKRKVSLRPMASHTTSTLFGRCCVWSKLFHCGVSVTPILTDEASRQSFRISYHNF